MTDSNRRPSAYKAGALPTELIRHKSELSSHAWRTAATAPAYNTTLSPRTGEYISQQQPDGVTYTCQPP